MLDWTHIRSFGRGGFLWTGATVSSTSLLASFGTILNYGDSPGKALAAFGLNLFWLSEDRFPPLGLKGGF